MILYAITEARDLPLYISGGRELNLLLPKNVQVYLKAFRMMSVQRRKKVLISLVFSPERDIPRWTSHLLLRMDWIIQAPVKLMKELME